MSKGGEALQSPQLDLDSAAFDAKVFLRHVVQTKSLAELLQLDNDLRKEIKHLDANLKTLVQNNFYKFVMAGETLKTVASEMETMQQTMANVDEKMSSIEALNSSIGANLSDKRAQVEALNARYEFLERLQVLADVPIRIEAALEVPLNFENFKTPGSLTSKKSPILVYNDAVSLYKQSKEIFEKLSSVPTIAAIANKSEELMAKVRVKLYEIFDSLESSTTLIFLITILLHRSGECAETLQTRYLTSRLRGISAAILKWKQFTINPATPDEPKQQTYTRFVAGLHKDFVSPLFNVLQSYYDVFLSEGSPTAEFEESQATLKASMKNLFDEYISCLGTQLVKADSPIAVISCMQLIEHDFKEAVEHPARLALKGTPDQFVLDFVQNQAPSILEALSTQLIRPYFAQSIELYESPLRAFASALHSAFLSGEVSAVLGQLNEEVHRVDKALSDQFNSSFTSLSGMVTSSKSELILRSILIQLRSILREMSTFASSAFEDPLNSLLNAAAVDDLEPGVRNQLFDYVLLFLCRVHYQLSLGAFRLVDQRVSQFLDVVSSVHQGEDLPIKLWPVPAASASLDTAIASAKRFSSNQSERLSKLVVQFFDVPESSSSSWLKKPEPQSVGITVVMIADEFAEVRSRVTGTLVVEKNDLASLSGLTKGAITKLDQYFDPIAVFSGIVEAAMSAGLEAIKRVSFSCEGYQQLQIDLAYFRTRMLSDGASSTFQNLVSNYVDELLHIAWERAVRPIPLEEAKITLFVNKAKK